MKLIIIFTVGIALDKREAYDVSSIEKWDLLAYLFYNILQENVHSSEHNIRLHFLFAVNFSKNKSKLSFPMRQRAVKTLKINLTVRTNRGMN